MYPQQNILNQTQPRRAWDEKLPDGRTVAEMIREKLTSPVTAVQPPANGQQVRYTVPDSGPSTSTGEPSPKTLLPATPTESASTYDPSSTATRPPIVGGSLETDPLKRNAARIQTMMAHPTREVSATGSAGTSHPMGRKKAALLAALYGLSQGDRNTTLAERLAAGGTAALIGAVKPRLIQEGQRRMEVEDAQGQLAQQTKLLTGQEQLDHLRAETESLRQGRKQYVERNDGVYEISKEYPNGRRVADIPAEAKAKPASARHYFERDDGVYYADDEHPDGVKLSGVPGKPASAVDTRMDVERGAKREAAQAEYDQLVSDEQKAGEEKNRAYTYLGELKANPSVAKEDVAEATKAAEEANKIYQSFSEKKRDAQRRVRENSGSLQKKLDPGLERKVRAAARAKNLDPDVAVERALVRQ